MTIGHEIQFLKLGGFSAISIVFLAELCLKLSGLPQYTINTVGSFPSRASKNSSTRVRISGAVFES